MFGSGLRAGESFASALRANFTKSFPATQGALWRPGWALGTPLGQEFVRFNLNLCY